MRRLARNETYDESLLVHLNSEALDFRVASELFSSRKELDQAALAVRSRHGGIDKACVNKTSIFAV
jgi:hypothetical protein